MVSYWSILPWELQFPGRKLWFPLWILATTTSRKIIRLLRLLQILVSVTYLQQVSATLQAIDNKSINSILLQMADVLFFFKFCVVLVNNCVVLLASVQK